MPAENPQQQHEDVWSDWLLHHRHGDDPQYGEVVRAAVEAYADRVLDGAQLSPGLTVADIGTGEGLIAFRAIDRVGPTLRVVLTDVSAAMLQCARTSAVERGLLDQCTFLQCPADKLDGILDCSVDVVTTRAVLAYVSDKHAALQEFYRILKPGGRISIAEPIFQDEALYARELKKQVDSLGDASPEPLLKLLHRWKAAQFPDTEEQYASNPLVNYSERDLLNLVHGSRFIDIHLELHMDVKRSPITSWDVFLRTSPHPWAPPLNVILAEQFTSEERTYFEQLVRPSVESGTNTVVDRIVYFTASKPAE